MRTDSEHQYEGIRNGPAGTRPAGTRLAESGPAGDVPAGDVPAGDVPLGTRPADRRARRLFLCWLALWTALNGLTLTRFPYVHSDEPWLSGLSRAMLEARSFLVTEPFFDRYPRQVHALKLLFHMIQAGFIQGFGHQLFSVRLISLLAGALVLFLLFQFGRRVFRNNWAALGLSVLFGVHIQFIYAAHLARQEILLLAVLVFAALCYESTRSFRYWLTPLVIGLSALIHPNAFLVAAMIGLVVLKDVLTRRIPFRRLAQFGGILAGCAAGLLGLSIALTPDFLSNYAQFGAVHAVDADPVQRGQNLAAFFVKLAERISGTYWLADLRFWFALAAVVVPAAVLVLLLGGKRLPPESRRSLENALLGLAGFLLAVYVIGRNNPTSILFALFPLLVLTGQVIWLLGRAPAAWGKVLALMAAGGILLIGLTGSIGAIRPFLTPQSDPYTVYSREIQANLPPDAVVLGNLSAGFVLADVPFFDIRNLEYIAPADPDAAADSATPDSPANPAAAIAPANPAAAATPAVAITPADIAAYIRARKINTVIWYEEYDYILRNPQWRILYEEQADDTTAADTLASLKAVLEENGTPIYTFESSVYGTRIVRFMGDYPWKVSLYRLDPAAVSGAGP